MSTVHAYAENCEPTRPLSLRPLADAMETLNAGVARLITRMQDRRTLRRLGRVSDHDLADMGFERDWDGSVIRIQS